MTSIRAREAGPADVPLLVTLMKEFYAESDYPLPEGPAARTFEALLASPSLGRVWILERDGEPAGHVVLTLSFSMEYGGLRGFVDDLFVRQAHRGHGVATAGLAEVRRACEALGVRALIVETSTANEPAMRTYLKSGFTDKGHVWLTLPIAEPVHLALETAADLEARFQAATLRVTGEVRALVVRKGEGAHDMPDRVELTPEGGVQGDRWKDAEAPNPEAQVSIIDRRVAEILVGGDAARLHAPGDNIVVDMDVDEASLPVGTRLRLGAAILEVTPKPHRGCAKFRERFGDAALLWVSEKETLNRRRRGVYARVVEAGAVAVGDWVTRVEG